MKLTDNLLRQLPVPKRGKRIHYDAAVKGFGCRVSSTGTRAFILTYRRKSDAQQRRITIGSFPDWSVAAAREEARRLKRKVDSGGDPLGEQETVRDAPTIADLCDRFEQDYIPRKRPSTQRVYKQQIAADIRPALGKTKVADLTHAKIDTWHHKLSARGPTHANRTLAVLSRIFSLAIRWGWRPDNPCRGIERNLEEKRFRYLTIPELERLARALDKLLDQGAADAVRLLLLTGARRGELLAAQWADIDFDARIWTKPGATTKQKTTHRVPLSDAAVRVLSDMRERAALNAEYLFPARGGGHRPHINAAWIELRKAAKLSDIHLHDLRHTYASVLASAGQSLPIIGALLGHTTPVTTARYTHLFDDPLRDATERASDILTGRPSAPVVPLTGARREG
jgi:integrase